MIDGCMVSYTFIIHVIFEALCDQLSSSKIFTLATPNGNVGQKLHGTISANLFCSQKNSFSVNSSLLTVQFFFLPADRHAVFSHLARSLNPYNLIMVHSYHYATIYQVFQRPIIMSEHHMRNV